MELEFPLEFNVRGTAVSLQCGNSNAKSEWKATIKRASHSVLPQNHFATDRPLAVTLFYFTPDEMVGDVDNIVKLILDALKQHISWIQIRSATS